MAFNFANLYLKPSVYQHFAHSHLQYNFEQHKSRHFKLIRLFELCSFTLWLFRLINIALMHKFGNSYWKYDEIALLSRDRFDLSLQNTIIGMCLFGVLCQKVIYYSGYERSIAWLKYYEVEVVGRELVGRCLKPSYQVDREYQVRMRATLHRARKWQIAQNFSRANLERIVDLIVQGQMLIALDHINLHRLMTTKFEFKLFPTLSLKVRKRLILAQIVLDKAIQVTLTVIPFFVLAFWCYYGPIILSQYRAFVWPLILLDFALLSYNVYMIMRNSILICGSVLLFATLYTSHMNEYNKALKHCVNNRSYRIRRCGFTERQDLLWLQSFLYDHVYYSVMIGLEDRLWSPFVLSVTLCQVPANIYLVNRLYFKLYSSVIEQAIIVVFVAGQAITMALVFWAMARVPEAMHASRHYIPAIQWMLPRSAIAYKLKMLQLYERVNREEHFGWSFGPHSAVTDKTLLDISVVYGDWFLNSFALFMKKRM